MKVVSIEFDRRHGNIKKLTPPVVQYILTNEEGVYYDVLICVFWNFKNRRIRKMSFLAISRRRGGKGTVASHSVDKQKQ